MLRSISLVCLLSILLTACAPVPPPANAGMLPPTITHVASVASSPALTSTPVSVTVTPSLTLVQPSPTTSPTASPPACQMQGGRLERTSLPDRRLHLPMEVIVYLPPCYDQEIYRRYPVLYLLHGQNYTAEQWVDLGIPAQADALMGSGEIPPFLIVMPHDRLWVDPPDTPFDEVFLEVLLPWVDQTYRTQAQRNFRAVGGLSRGGAWAIHFGLHDWAQFGAFAGHSAPVFWSDAPFIDDWLAAIPSADMPQIYLDIGVKDYLRDSNDWFEAQLNAHTVVHEWHLYSGYHEEAYWQAHLAEYLRWYGGLWQAAQPEP
ncbi:MAG: hypothetical protein Fur0018_19370 [Anaerolineales bacterium]